MTSFNPFSIPIVSFSILSFLNLMTPATGANYLYHFCENSTFGANRLYQTSINSLLSSLSSSATRNIEFYNTTVNQNTSNPAYGLYICHGDVTSEVCQGCVAAATEYLTNKCSTEKVAVICVNVYYVMGFRPNCFTCTAHLYLYCTLLVPHTYASYIRH